MGVIFFASVFESHDVAACCFAAAPLREQEEESKEASVVPSKTTNNFFVGQEGESFIITLFITYHRYSIVQRCDIT